MKSRTLMLAGFAVVAIAMVLRAADGVSLEGIKCIMAANKDAKADNAVEYRGAKVFFCCGNCSKGFAADPAKHAAKANHQLVATKQFTQVKCPISGGPLADGTEVKVGGIDVKFCCMNCKAKAEKSEDAVSLLFADKSFDKGFEAKKAETK